MGLEEITIKILNEFENWNSNFHKPHQLIYLIQIFVKDIGYRHSWYYIPFAKTLQEGVNNYMWDKKNYDQKIEEIKLKPEIEKKLKKVKQIISPPPTISIDRWLDLLTSLHYFRNICGVKKDKFTTFLELDENRFQIYKKNHERKFSLEEFKLAWDKLKEFGLLDKKHIRN